MGHQIACQFEGSNRKTTTTKNTTKKKTREEAGKKGKQEGAIEQLFGVQLGHLFYGILLL